MRPGAALTSNRSTMVRCHLKLPHTSQRSARLSPPVLRPCVSHDVLKRKV